MLIDASRRYGSRNSLTCDRTLFYIRPCDSENRKDTGRYLIFTDANVLSRPKDNPYGSCDYFYFLTFVRIPFARLHTTRSPWVTSIGSFSSPDTMLSISRDISAVFREATNNEKTNPGRTICHAKQLSAWKLEEYVPRCVYTGMYHFSTHNSSICAAQYRDTVVSLFLSLSFCHRNIRERHNGPLLASFVSSRVTNTHATSVRVTSEIWFSYACGIQRRKKKERRLDGASGLAPFANSTHACPRISSCRLHAMHVPESEATTGRPRSSGIPGNEAIL